MAAKRSREQRAADRAKLAQLALFGNKTQEQMAQEIGIDQTTVSRELKRIREDWRQSALQDIDEVIARELKKLDQLELEALQEWERSKRDWTKKVVEDKPRSKGVAGKSARIETGSQTGDPRYLQVLISIQDRRSKLLGIDKPQKMAPTTPDGSQPYRNDMTDAEIDRRIAELAAKCGDAE